MTISAPPVLDRVPFFDQRSRDYAVRAAIGATRLRRKRMWTPRPYPLDQAKEGACVGFAWSGELACTPRRHVVDNSSARTLYQQARDQDRMMGNNWAEGASLLAGAKACLNAGLITRYLWAFGAEDVVAALVARGPVVLGVNWYSDMYQTRADGLLSIGGRLVGGHAILAFGFWPDHPVFGVDVVAVQNSWGMGWGQSGVGFLPVPELDALLEEQGEACVAVDAAPRLLVGR